MPRWAGVLLMVLCCVEAASGDVLMKVPHLRCSACKAVANELLEKRQKMIDENNNPVQVSHRLGNGKWDPHGGGGVKKMTYATSELQAIDTMEGICESSAITRYRLRLEEVDKTRIFSQSSTLKSAESYNKADKDIIKDSSKLLSRTCHELLELHDDEIAEKLRVETIDSKEFEKSVCTSISDACKDEEKHRKRERANRDAFEQRRTDRINKTRREGTSSSFQIADLHFSLNGTEVDIKVLKGTASSESGSHPSSEAPRNVLDANPSTKWLDHDKKALFIEFDANVTLDAFTFTTANDYPERDPVEWEFSGLVHVEVEEKGEEGKAEEVPVIGEDAKEGEAGNEKQEVKETETEEGKEEEVKEEVVEEWTVLHTTDSVAHDVPHDRSHKLQWFTFPETTHRRFRFKPIAKEKKKKQKKAKKDKTAPNTAKPEEEL